MLNDTQRAMVQAIATHGPISRTDLAQTLDLSKPAVTGLAKTLLQSGIILEAPLTRAGPRQGRPSIGLCANPRFGYFAGVSTAREKNDIALVDFAGRVLMRKPLSLPATPEGVADRIAGALPGMSAELGAGAGQLLGIGVSVSGLVDPGNRICRHSALLDWHDVPLADLVSARAGVPAIIANDANTVATGEKLFGSAREEDDFAVITVGDGIGCASFLGGKLYTGHNGGAGEIAHITVDPNGRPCRCGKRGCLDTVASRGAMLTAAQEAGLTITELGQIEQLAARRDPQALELIHNAASALGMVIMQIVHIHDPKSVIVVDTVGAMGHMARAIIRQTVATHVLPEMSRSFDLRFTVAPEGFWSISAASMAAHQFFAAA